MAAPWALAYSVGRETSIEQPCPLEGSSLGRRCGNKRTPLTTCSPGAFIIRESPARIGSGGLLVSHAEKRPEVVAEAKRLRRTSPTTGERRSLQRISRELAAKGYVNERGQPFNPKSVRAMLERK